ncbi:hypothetical protein EPUL_003313 [Erysiphe pulchra]|uniref:Uncharacterized protein n=1 Tax=Erysiphe pulchra TaxID=225359 RepID=A0A2S4PTU0_9PEZI|nr:hypothetical protein EPUL_003313 [Erysiphe pulchra]
MDVVTALILAIIILFFPPLAVFIVSGCGADLLINILLTLLGFFPGMIHAFYLEFVYFDRREKPPGSRPIAPQAPEVYSEPVQDGSHVNDKTI